MNDLQKWETINNITPYNNFSSFVQLVKTLDNSNSDHWVKWKSMNNHCVIGTENYFYKIYVCGKINKFDMIIREKLASIYRNFFNIVWDILTIEKDGIYFQLERRQPLQVVSSDNFTNEEILQSWSKILVLLEEELGFNNILQQLKAKKSFNNVESIKLIRDNVTNAEDYAIIDNQIILLDDADWFIALLDKDNNWIPHQCSLNKISLYDEDYYFMPIDLMTRISKHSDEVLNIISEHIQEEYDKWFIYDKPTENFDVVDFKQLRHDHIKNNIQILTSTNKPLSLVKY